MPSLKPAQHFARPKTGVGGRQQARAYVRVWNTIYTSINNTHNWALAAARYHARARNCIALMFVSVLAYALHIAIQMPNNDAVRAWLWPAAETIGLTIKTVEIQGYRQDSEIALKAAAHVETGMPIFLMDVQSVQARIAALPGVKMASVQTLLPNTVRILVEEREPFAIWQQRGERAVIDEDGEIITRAPDDRYRNLPMVVGQGADKAAIAFFAELDRYPEIRKRAKYAIYVAERRWNLTLSEGVDVKLPATGLREALADLDKIQREYNVADKDITTIDLRFSDRVIVRLSDSAAQHRQEQLKNRFGKKTNGKPA